MAYKSGNPALNQSTFQNLINDNTSMTLEGTANKSLIMFVLAVISGVIGWRLQEFDSTLGIRIILAAVTLGFILSMVLIFKKKMAPVLAPVYALLEGVALGGISRQYETAFQGIVLQAIFLTAGIFLSMLLLYRCRIIKATENFKLGIAAATGGIALFYLVAFIGSFFSLNMPLIHDSSFMGIVFSLLVVMIAALNLVIDFDFIEEGVKAQAPAYMEWYASFGLFVTLVWLYLEILRLLAKSRK